LESKEELIVQLANEYMEYLSELAGDGNEDFVVSLINNVYCIITEKDTDILTLRYQDENGNPVDLEEVTKEQHVTRTNLKNSRGSERKNENFPTLSEDVAKDMEDALGFVRDVFEDIGYALEATEGDNEILKMEIEKVKKRNAHLADQAKKLYQLNEYQGIKIRDLEETLDDLFTQGELQDTEEGTEDESDEEESKGDK